MSRLRKFIKGTLLLINILFLLLLILFSFTIPNISPEKYWSLGLLGLGSPILIGILFFFTLFWIFFSLRNLLLNVVILAVCWSFVSVTFAWHFKSPKSDPNKKTLKVMTYNVHYFRTMIGQSDPEIREKIISLIKDQNPDILCLQEFFTSESPRNSDNKSKISQRLELPYFYFSSNRNFQNNHSGVIIFSRFPILKAAKFDLSREHNKEIAIQADIRIEQDTFRVFNAHLQSIHLNEGDIHHLEKIKQQSNEGLKGTGTILRKLKTAFQKRAQQILVLSQKIKESPYPVIIAGDFNDPPHSFTYFQIKKGLKDSFLESGFGMGSTYSKISPTLRIDYILHDPRLRAIQSEVIHKPYSDHYALVSDFQY